MPCGSRCEPASALRPADVAGDDVSPLAESAPRLRLPFGSASMHFTL